MNPVFNGTRLKTTLKMAISKLKFLQEKKLALGKQQRRQLADLLALGKETSATIRVENIIRDDIYVELLEYLELYCELLLARISLLLDLQRTEVDPGLKEAVASVIYSCSHVEVKEVAALGDMLKMRYGPDYSRRVLESADGVSEKVVKRCDIEPPSSELVMLYLTEIARAYEVPYSQAGEDFARKTASGKGPEGTEEKGTEGSAEKEKDQPEDVPVRELSEFDKLKERFAALKR